MENSYRKNILIICLFLTLLFGSVSAITPILSYSISNEVVASTTAGNELITGTCTSSDTCQIWASGGVAALASGTTTVNLNLNSIVVNANGYNSFYANDITGSSSSAANTVRVLTATNSLPMTFNNIQSTAIVTGTPLELVFNNKLFALQEATSANNMFLATSSGIIIALWNEGNTLNESNPVLSTATKDILWTPDQAGFLAAGATNTLIMEWTAPGVSALDSNLICQAPQLNSYSGGTYGQFDCGNTIFQSYNSFGNFASNSIPVGYTNNVFNIYDRPNSVSLTCASGWCSLYQTSSSTIATSGNAFDIYASGKILAGTTSNLGTPDGLMNKGVEQGPNCQGGNSLCTNIGGGFKQTNAIPSIYGYNGVALWNPAATTNVINVYNAIWTNWFDSKHIIDALYTNPISSNYLLSPFPKQLYADNLSNATSQIKFAKQYNYSSQSVIVYDTENWTSNPHYDSQYAQKHLASSITNFCALVHASGFLCGVAPEVTWSGPGGLFAMGPQLVGVDWSQVDYLGIQAQAQTNSGPAMSNFVNALVNNAVTANPNLFYTVQIDLAFPEALNQPALANSVVLTQIANVLAIPSVRGMIINYFPTDSCSIATCTPDLVANDVNTILDKTPLYSANAVTPQVYSLEDMRSNTVLMYDYNWVQHRTGTSGLAATYFGFYMQGGQSTVANVSWMRTRILPENGIMPRVSYNSLGVMSGLNFSSNALAQSSGNTLTLTAAFQGGQWPFTYNFVLVNTVTNAVVNTIVFSDVNSTANVIKTSFLFSGVGNWLKANVVVTDSATPNVVLASNYIYLPPILSASNTPNVDAGQYILFTANSGAGTSPWSYNYQIENTITDAIIANSLYKSVTTSSNTYLFSTTGFGGNTIQVNVILVDTSINQKTLAAAPTTGNSLDSVTINIDPPLFAGNIIPQLPAIDAGQIILLTANVFNGTTPYTAYQWYTIIGTTAPLCNSANAISGATSSTYLASPLTTNSYTYQVTDSASTPSTSCSGGDKITENPALLGTVVYSSNSIVDQGQWETITYDYTGGSPNFNANMLISNSLDANPIICNSITAGVATQFQTLTCQIPATSNALGPSIFIEGNTIDSATTPENYILTNTIAINPQFVAATPTATNTLLVNSQYTRLSSSASGGSPTYSYQWYSIAGSTAPLCNAANAISGATGTTYLAQPQITNTFAYKTTDSASTANIICTAGLTIPVNAAATFTLTASNSFADNQQYLALTVAAAAGKGVGPFDNRLYNGSTGIAVVGIANVLILTIGGSNTFSTFQLNSPTNANSFTWYTLSTDKGPTTPITLTSTMPIVIVNSILQQGNVVSSNSIVDQGQWETITGVWSGGTLKYTWNGLASNAIDAHPIIGNLIASSITTGTGSFTFQIPSTSNALGTILISSNVLDGATTPVSNVITNTITINPALAVATITPSTPSTDPGQPILLTGSASSGTPPYSYQWYSGSSATCTSDTAVTNAIQSTYLVMPIASTYYCYQVTDSASTPNLVKSATDQITVAGTTLGMNIIPSNTLLDANQFERFTGSISGGVGAFNSLVFNLTAWSRIQFPIQQNSNILIASGGTNSILFQTNAPQFLVLPAGKGITNTLLISIVNLQAVNSTKGFQYPIVINGLNLTSYTANNLQNILFANASGNIIPSIFVGSLSNPLGTNNLATDLGWVLKLNTIVPGTNLASFNASMATNFNHPSCSGIDGSVSVPSADHGLYIYTQGQPTNNATIITNNNNLWSNTIQYLSSDQKICGIMLSYSWKQLEPTQGVINYSVITRDAAPWLANNFQVGIVIYPTSGSASKNYTPQWVMSGSPNINCGPNPVLPVYWQGSYFTYWKGFAAALANKYNGNNSISFIRLGIADSTATLPFSSGTNATCVGQWQAKGFSTANWTSYVTNALNYLPTLNPTFTWEIGTSAYNNTVDIVSAIAANDTIGIGNEGYGIADVNNYLSGEQCGTDSCNNANQYQGVTPNWIQTTATTRPSGVGIGSLNELLAFGLYTHIQTFEIYPNDLLIVDNSNFSNHTLAGPQYNSILLQAANIIGWRSSPATANAVSTPFIAPKTNLIIYMEFASTGTNEFDGANVGEMSWLSTTYGQYNNCATIFISCNTFGGQTQTSLTANGWVILSNTLLGTTANYITLDTNTMGFVAGIVEPINSVFNPGYPIVWDTYGKFYSYQSAFSANNLHLGVFSTSTNTLDVQEGFACGRNVGANVCKMRANTIGYGPTFSSLDSAFTNINIWGVTTGSYSEKNSSVLFNFVNHATNQTGTTQLINIATNSPLTSSQYFGWKLNGNASIANNGIPNIWLLGTDARIAPPGNILPQTRIASFVISTGSSGGQITQSPAFKKIYYSLISTDLGTTPKYTIWNTTPSASAITIYQILKFTDPVVSNTVLDLGEYQAVTSTVAGGAPPYFYGYNIIAPNGLLLNNVILQNAATSNTYAYQHLSAWGAGTFTVNTFVRDSASTPVVITNSITYLANNAVVAGAITPASPSINSGQSIFLTSHASSGTPLYTYKWYTITGSASPLCNSANAISGATSSTYLASPLTTNSYTYQVTDSAASPTSACSSFDTITITNSLTINSIVSSNSIGDIGQTELLTATFVGGNSPFTGNFYITNSMNGNAIANSIQACTSPCTYKFTLPNVPNDIGTMNIKFTITDSSTIPVIISATNTMTVFSPTMSLTLSPSNNIFGSAIVTANALCVGCATPLTWAWTVNNANIANSLVGAAGSSATLVNPPIGTYVFNVIATDTGTTSPYILPLISNTLTVQSVVPAVNFQNATGINSILVGNTFTANTFIPYRLYGNVTTGVTYNGYLATAYYSDIVFKTNTALKGILYAHNITINSGIWLTTNGWPIISTGTFTNNGVVYTGNYPNGGLGGSGVPGAGMMGGNFPLSYGGSGASGGTGFGAIAGGAGGNTLAIGGQPSGNAGSLPSPPTLTNALIQSFLTGNFPTYLTGAGGGGGGGGNGCSAANGGNGAYGQFIEAFAFANVGTINAIGQRGQALCSGGANAGGSAGGGGGLVLLVSNTAISSTAGVLVTGGTGAASTGGGGTGGNGGNGNVMKYQPGYLPFNGLFVSNVVLFTQVTSFNYLSQPSYPSGIYYFIVNSLQNSAITSTYINLSVNTTSISSALSCNAPTIQYYANACYAPTFTANPLSWSILSELPINQNSNTVVGGQNYDIWSNSTLSFFPKITLNYGFMSFVVNALNNPLITNIVQTEYVQYNQTSSPAFPNNRLIVGVNTFVEPNYMPLNAITTYNANSLLNHYSLPIIVTTNSYNSFGIYVPEGNFLNPTISLTQQKMFTSAGNYLPRTNNPYSFTSVFANSEMLNIYLPSNTTASQYTVSAYGCSAYAVNYTLTVINTATNPQNKVQQYLITQVPFLMPLLNSYTYQFILNASNGVIAFISGATSPTNPISIYANCNNTVHLISQPNINVSCKGINEPGNTFMATCTGVDTKDKVTGWIVNFTNQTTVLGYTVVNSVFLPGNSFSTTYNFNTNKSSFYYVVTAEIGNVFDPSQVYSGPLNLLAAKPLNYDLAWAAILLILVPMALLYFDRTALIIFEVFVVVAGQAVGIFAFSVYDITAFIVLVAIIIIIDERNK